ncbi:hypothetical protein HPB49_011755 [Dermacentor silvarum]|uniref:Uncharacterized protein n=1 Tax=Dermacentor silvarum TaxID=543639 RepID=A0ACB8DZU9_DERSI|nr:hypothetical protein HPB49_011755 [Dermacentor silvarum]
MVAAVVPSNLSYTETYNTVKYAERAKKIKLQAKKNVLIVKVHMFMHSVLIDEYEQEVEGLQRKLENVVKEKTALKAEVGELKDGLGSVTTSRYALLPAQETGGGGSGPARLDGPLDLASLLHAHDWRLATTVRRKLAALPSGNIEDLFEGYTGNTTFFGFPNGTPHPRRHRRSGSAGMVTASANAHGTILESDTVERGERRSKVASV